MNKAAQKTLDVAGHRHAIKGYIGTVITLLGLLGYNKVGAPAMSTLVTIANDLLVSGKTREVRQNIIIHQNKVIINYLDMFTRLNYRKADVNAVKLEIKLEKEWD